MNCTTIVRDRTLCTYKSLLRQSLIELIKLTKKLILFLPTCFTTLRVGHSVNTPWQNEDQLFIRWIFVRWNVVWNFVREKRHFARRGGRTTHNTVKLVSPQEPENRETIKKRKFAFSEGTRTLNDWSTGDSKFDKVVYDMPLKVLRNLSNSQRKKSDKRQNGSKDSKSEIPNKFEFSHGWRRQILVTTTCSIQ